MHSFDLQRNMLNTNMFHDIPTIEIQLKSTSYRSRQELRISFHPFKMRLHSLNQSSARSTDIVGGKRFRSDNIFFEIFEKQSALFCLISPRMSIISFGFLNSWLRSFEMKDFTAWSVLNFLHFWTASRYFLWFDFWISISWILSPLIRSAYDILVEEMKNNNTLRPTFRYIIKFTCCLMGKYLTNAPCIVLRHAYNGGVVWEHSHTKFSSSLFF